LLRCEAYLPEQPPWLFLDRHRASCDGRPGLLFSSSRPSCTHQQEAVEYILRCSWRDSTSPCLRRR
jgi:hypothetical protein